MNLTREQLEEMLKIARYASRGFKLNQDIMSHHNTYIKLLESVLGLSDAIHAFNKADDEIVMLDAAYTDLLEALDKYGVK